MSKNGAVRTAVSYDTKPTSHQYTALQHAYDHFNEALFGGTLPACLITLQRHRSAYGFFDGDRFRSRTSAVTTDEIALNPTHCHRPLDAVLSTLVHEMCHLWQHHFGRPSRAAYHNKEWVAKMMEVGLTPSVGGLPGGKMTGQRMTHYVTPDGPFAAHVTALLDGGFSLDWFDAPEGATPALNKNKVKYTCPICGQNAWAKSGAHLACGDCTEPMEAV